MFPRRGKIFLVFTFTLTWLSWWFLAYLTGSNILAFESAAGQFLYILGGSAPTIGAYVAVVATKDAGSLREFHSRVFKVRVAAKLYAFSILVPVGLGVTTLGISLLTDPAYLADNPPQSIFLFIPFFIIAIFMGGLEEFGWRGVLQPVLTNRINLFTANLIIGLTWDIWHLPVFYIAGTSLEGNPFFLFALAGIGYSAFMTWLYAETESVFLCVLFHASINATATAGLFTVIGHTTAYTLSSVFIFTAGLLFLLAAQKKITSP